MPPLVRDCRSCVSCPDSYEIDDEGKCNACGDSKIETVTVCDGCDEEGHVLAFYVVEYHDGGDCDDVAYCADCAGLARMDWNGETKSITAKEVSHV